MTWSDHHTPDIKCTACGHKMDMAANPRGLTPPSPGDRTFCINCGHLMAFTHDMALRDLDFAEWLVAESDPQVQRIRRAWLEMKEAQARERQ